MRVTLLSVLISTVVLPPQLPAQAPRLEVQAGLGYARLFAAGGISFTAAVQRSVSSPASRLQHALGGSLWYAHTGIKSVPGDPYGRHVVGLGVRYQMALRRAESFRPFVAVPLQVMHSSIPDRAMLASPALLLAPVPQSGSPAPIEDRIGGAWGWGTGLELGFRVGTGRRLSGQTSVQLLYQDIYGPGSRNGAWNWHAGITYGLHGS